MTSDEIVPLAAGGLEVGPLQPFHQLLLHPEAVGPLLLERGHRAVRLAGRGPRPGCGRTPCPARRRRRGSWRSRPGRAGRWRPPGAATDLLVEGGVGHADVAAVAAAAVLLGSSCDGHAGGAGQVPDGALHAGLVPGGAGVEDRGFGEGRRGREAAGRRPAVRTPTPGGSPGRNDAEHHGAGGAGQDERRPAQVLPDLPRLGHVRLHAGIVAGPVGRGRRSSPGRRPGRSRRRGRRRCADVLGDWRRRAGSRGRRRTRRWSCPRGAEANEPSVVANSISRSQKSCSAAGATPALTRAAREQRQQGAHVHVLGAHRLAVAAQVAGVGLPSEGPGGEGAHGQVGVGLHGQLARILAEAAQHLAAGDAGVAVALQTAGRLRLGLRRRCSPARRPAPPAAARTTPSVGEVAGARFLLVVAGGAAGLPVCR